MKLTNLPVGNSGRVIELNCRGKVRRRLLDLGLIPGTEVTAQNRSPLGEPTAFLIRGTTIALRSKETDLVEIKQIIP